MPIRLSPAGAPLLRSPFASIDALIDREVENVRRAVATGSFPHDPVLGEMSRTASMAASLVRRHGLLSASMLARAIDILAADQLEVLPEYTIPLTRVANDLARANANGRLGEIDLPAEGIFDGTYRSDILLVSEELRTAWIIEIKRFNSAYGRKMLQPLRRLEVARLSATPIIKGAYRVSHVETALISLYGESSHPDVVTRDRLDAFFGLNLQVVLDDLDQRYAVMAAEVLRQRVREDLSLMDRLTTGLTRDGRDTQNFEAVEEKNGRPSFSRPLPADLFRHKREPALRSAVR